MKKLLAAILAALTVLTCLTACGKPAEPAETTLSTTTGAASDTQTTTTAVTTDSIYDDDLPDDLNFGEQELSILYWNDVARPEFEVEDQTGDLISDAIFLRNAAVEERLGLKLD